MDTSWWMYMILVILVFLILLGLHYLVKKMNENKFEERYVQLYKKHSESAQVQMPLIDIEIKGNGRPNAKDDEKDSTYTKKGQNDRPKKHRLATTWSTEVPKSDYFYNKGVIFTSNDNLRIPIPDMLSMEDTKPLGVTNYEALSNSSSRTADSYPGDIYSLVKQSSNMQVREEMKADEYQYFGKYLGAIYKDQNSPHENIETVIESTNINNNSNSNHNVHVPSETTDAEKEINLLLEEVFNDVFVESRKEHPQTENSQTTVNGDIEYKDPDALKLNDNTLEHVPLTTAILNNIPNPELLKTIIEQEETVNETLVHVEEIQNYQEFKENTDELKNDLISSRHTVRTIEKLESIPICTGAKLGNTFVPRRALSTIDETGISDVSDSIGKTISEAVVVNKSKDSRLASSDHIIHVLSKKTSYKAKLEPNVSTSSVKGVIESFLYNSEDNTTITYEKSESSSNGST